MTAPQPPLMSAEPPRPVIRKLGLASATTKPSNQLIVFRSSRSSTTAVAIHTSENDGEEAVERYPTGFWLTGQADLPPWGGRHIGTTAHTAGPCQWGGPWRKMRAWGRRRSRFVAI